MDGWISIVHCIIYIYRYVASLTHIMHYVEIVFVGLGESDGDQDEGGAAAAGTQDDTTQQLIHYTVLVYMHVFVHACTWHFLHHHKYLILINISPIVWKI